MKSDGLRILTPVFKKKKVEQEGNADAQSKNQMDFNRIVSLLAHGRLLG